MKISEKNLRNLVRETAVKLTPAGQLKTAMEDFSIAFRKVMMREHEQHPLEWVQAEQYDDSVAEQIEQCAHELMNTLRYETKQAIKRLQMGDYSNDSVLF